ncbi:MAG TPA: hypothetical protein VFU81_07645 [Thermomicrobiales bacterium]|nr:hypothetical protein [Thermomicrobiales bacterium]
MFRTLTRWSGNPFVLIGVALLLVVTTFGIAEAKKSKKPDATGVLEASNACLGNASGTIKLFKLGDVEKMIVSVQGLPKNTEFDVFVIQQAKGPNFGLSWYQGDLSTDKNGNGSQQFLGRFSIETFIVGVGATSAPRPHNTDQVGNNPTTNPVHTFHVGLWFNSPADAQAAGCPNTVTPFNGDHTAGIQALRTQDVTIDINGVPTQAGPLAQIQ